MTTPKRKMPEYKSFVSARHRCNNPSNAAYQNYGGRGINMLFDSFEAFFADIGPRPSPDHSIDRIDNDRGYEAGNLRWATRSEQSLNQRKARMMTITCSVCGISALKSSSGGPAKYCDPCRKEVKRLQQNASASVYRNKKRALAKEVAK